MKMINSKDKVGACIILLFALIYLAVTFDIPIGRIAGSEVFNARTLPIVLAITTIFLCLAQIFMPTKELASETISASIKGFQWRPCLLLIVLMLGYGLTFGVFGFALATFLFLFIGFLILGERRYFLSVAIAAGVAVAMWLLLTQLFDIYLDSGDLYRLLANSLLAKSPFAES